MRSSEEWSRLGGVLIAVLAAVAALVVVVPRLLGAAAGPEVEIITSLKSTEQHGLALTVPGSSAQLLSQRHHFARITVNVAPDGRSAVAWATLDFTGSMGSAEISSLGVERVPFVRKEGKWVPERSAAPRLVAAVSVLEARRRALEAGDVAALSALRERESAGEADEGGQRELERMLAFQRRRYRVRAWYLRLERDEASVTEQWRLEGDLPERPVDERGQRQLSLLRRGEEFLFSSRLM